MKETAMTDFNFLECENYQELTKAIYDEDYDGYIFRDLTIVHAKNDASGMIILKSGIPIAMFEPHLMGQENLLAIIEFL
ncbi:hypothetical protein [Thermoactinomyces sp. DSM 45892]|uniref:hypothetical protein n=1 Tax=Thermoactinomyces sp. DSM 45892 TaxID=1882753 RepID=UPI00089B40DA|nr:hypothetical protein [Thermoactinomyces sp. DSM 45892]SDY71481.1 hypothetical protein SAMN05444416_107155 [Thermoactinomyces sp. DSM 45892]